MAQKHGYTREAFQPTLQEVSGQVADLFGVADDFGKTELVFDGNAEARGDFPARVLLGEPNQVLFDGEEFSSLRRQHNNISATDMARLYMGGGVAKALLSASVPPGQSLKVDKMYTIFASAEPLASQIFRADETFNKQEQNAILLNFLPRTEEDVAHLNLKRFVVGAVFMATAKSSGTNELQDTMVQLARYNLHDALGRDGSSYAKMGKLMGLPDRSEQVFADTISRTDIAMCFPMNSSDVSVILDIAQSNEVIDEEYGKTVVISSDVTPRNGFHLC